MNDKQLRMQLIKLAHSNPELRKEILPLLKQAGCEKLPEGGMRENCEKKKEEGAKGDKAEDKKASLKTAHGPVALTNPDVMLYFIDKAANSSKFYEMKCTRQGAQWVLQRRWGRLTDSASSGRVDSNDTQFPSEALAKAAMMKIQMEKSGKGYKLAPNQEYPIGLGAAGFGWGGQQACTYKPELRRLHDQSYVALSSLKELEHAVSELTRKQSSMASKLRTMFDKAVDGLEALEGYLATQLNAC